MRKFNKVFVIALPRCATVSVCEALGMLGVRTAHLGRIYGESNGEHHDPQRLIRMHDQVANEDFRLDILQICDGLADYPICCFDVMKQIDAAYPGSLFINVRRDGDTLRWLQSVERQFVGLQLARTGAEASPDSRRFMEAVLFFRELTFGQSSFEATVYHDAYHVYQAKVETYFRDRGSDFLNIADVTNLAQNGFSLLCNFLDCEQPEQDFPRSNGHSDLPYQAFMRALEVGRVVSQTGIKPIRVQANE